jgi:hypothetical protein
MVRSLASWVRLPQACTLMGHRDIGTNTDHNTRPCVLVKFCRPEFPLNGAQHFRSTPVRDVSRASLPCNRTVATLADLRRVTPWLWVICERCQHRAPTALAPWLIRWGPEASNDMPRRSACCGHRNCSAPCWRHSADLVDKSRHGRAASACAARRRAQHLLKACLQLQIVARKSLGEP